MKNKIKIIERKKLLEEEMKKNLIRRKIQKKKRIRNKEKEWESS